jgi:hypothetical protein
MDGDDNAASRSPGRASCPLAPIAGRSERLAGVSLY